MAAGVRLTARERLLRGVTEAAWQAQVLGVAKFGGWRVAHFRPALRQSGRGSTAVQADGAGFPDLFLVRAGRALAVELKREVGQPTEAQVAWLNSLARAGLEVGIWRPSDEPLMSDVLLRGAPMPPWLP